jgi:RNA ligase (TIGR02306 family)
MMAWVARIDEVRPIENADQIVAYRVGGWWVVDKKNAYVPGDLAVYASIDSWIPHAVAPFLSRGSAPREFSGVKGERLRTVVLRGTTSQGLLIKGATTPDGALLVKNPSGDEARFEEGCDVSDWLQIQKWEAPIPAQLSGQVKGAFPGFIPKTDQERVQNLVDEYSSWCASGATWEVTEKLDGSSMVVFVAAEEEGVCSRNLNLCESDSNSFWAAARRSQLLEKLRSTGRHLALQGELVGEGIQGNPYKIRGHEFYLFDIYDIDAGRHLYPAERQALAAELQIRQVPGCGMQQLDVSIERLLQMAEGKSVLQPTAEREGLVFKHAESSASFKAISNRFLLKTGN